MTPKFVAADVCSVGGYSCIYIQQLVVLLRKFLIHFSPLTSEEIIRTERHLFWLFYVGHLLDLVSLRLVAVVNYFAFCFDVTPVFT